jgi:transcriptional regulator with XRE-family HTH domain
MKAKLLVARNIRRLRVGRGLSQEALATDAGVDRTYVSRLERGLENPTIAVIERLAKALSYDLRDFFDPKPVAHGPIEPLPKGRKRRR